MSHTPGKWIATKAGPTMQGYSQGDAVADDFTEYTTTWADMEREAEEIITESMKRPLTPDEAACIAFHARVRCIKPEISNA